MTKQTFLQGTLILIVAGMVTRFLGFINRLVVARVMGEEGVGLYMMALPTLFLVITLSQLGLPVAISKRVAEAEAKKDAAKVRKILVVSLFITGFTSIFFTTMMFFFAPFIAKNLLIDDRTLLPLLIIIPVVPIIAICSVFKGYFQGKQNMKPQSYALILEQVVRILCVYIFVKILIPYGVEFAAAGAMVSVIIGELASLGFIIFMFKRQKNFQFHMRKRIYSYFHSSKQVIQELFSIALPSTGSRMIGSISNFLEPILISQSLAIAGLATNIATKQYGELTGYVMPLLFLPTFITNSLSIALVPSISEASAYQNEQLIHYRINQAIRISFASGALATIVLFLFADYLLMVMYGSSAAARLLVFMAPCYIFLYIQSPLQSTLQALDLAKPAMWNTIIGTIIKLVLLIFLASNPNFGIMGVAISMCVSVVLVTFLHLATLKKFIHFSLSFWTVCKMIFLLSLTFILGNNLKVLLFNVKETLFIFLMTIVLLTVGYIFFLFILKFITRDELKQIPILQNFVK